MKNSIAHPAITRARYVRTKDDGIKLSAGEKANKLAMKTASEKLQQNYTSKRKPDLNCILSCNFFSIGAIGDGDHRGNIVSPITAINYSYYYSDFKTVKQPLLLVLKAISQS